MVYFQYNESTLNYSGTASFCEELLIEFKFLKFGGVHQLSALSDLG